MRSGTISLANAAETDALGAALAGVLQPGDVVALSGPLGAGKTSLARGVLAALGLGEEAPSPSFSLVIAYAPPDVLTPVWHVDLYRIDEPGELAELGLDDARGDTALLIEWPERMGVALWPDALRLTLEPEPSGGRRLTWAAPAAWEGRWPPLRS
ncbi:tRNA (adenosine(37)-N6)-threonylcarbamoyltransferase complex ATPase subunit type 1 TsaE [Sphingomonas crusticola]|uniref:tRNA (adenosine(37)-N6)-threonylcarbamoyltransferase complex ATPase subunit type 1 TsaE n=1 Tax=Sphingomonas crusticola TaxID=1697973 RepID=UPI000E22C349|nr:tRNA (adenosine(37)-N6)-threonylcarbamoyltransferase complex ATPase subunit type 1 TsaE [Sphingomonas crusticola]